MAIRARKQALSGVIDEGRTDIDALAASGCRCIVLFAEGTIPLANVL